MKMKNTYLHNAKFLVEHINRKLQLNLQLEDFTDEKIEDTLVKVLSFVENKNKKLYEKYVKKINSLLNKNNEE